MGRLLDGLLRNSEIAAAANPAKVANPHPAEAKDSQESRDSQHNRMDMVTGLCRCLTVWRTVAGRFIVAGSEHDLGATGSTFVASGKREGCSECSSLSEAD